MKWRTSFFSSSRLIQRPIHHVLRCCKESPPTWSCRCSSRGLTSPTHWASVSWTSATLCHISTWWPTAAKLASQSTKLLLSCQQPALQTFWAVWRQAGSQTWVFFGWFIYWACGPSWRECSSCCCLWAPCLVPTPRWWWSASSTASVPGRWHLWCSRWCPWLWVWSAWWVASGYCSSSRAARDFWGHLCQVGDWDSA